MPNARGGPILVLGDVCAEFFIPINRLPLSGTVCLTNIYFNPSGSAAYVAQYARKLCSKVSIFGVIGKDCLGSEVKRQLKTKKIDCSGLVAIKGKTGKNLILLNQTGERSTLADTGVHVLLASKLSTNIPHTGFLFLPTYPAYWRIFRQIRNQRRVIFADYGWAQNKKQVRLAISRTAKYVDVAIFSGQSFGNRIDPVILEKLRQKGVYKFAITFGDRGTIVFDGERGEFISPLNVTCIDSCGAGDSFIAALMVEMSKGASLRVAANFASDYAGTKVSRMKYFPTRKEVEALSLMKARKNTNRIVFKSIPSATHYASLLLK